MTVLSRIDDPRILTVLVAALFSAALWLASWSVMGAADMAGMGMDGMAMGGGAMQGAMGDAAAKPMQMFGMSMDPGDWSVRTIAETASVWLLMMAAMMLPAMAPVLAIYAGISAKEDRGARLALRVAVFCLGYFLLWACFSVAASLAQLTLRDSALFTMGGTRATPVAAGALAVVAGLYQFTPLKAACLKHCRHPLHYLLQHWRPGLAGAFPVGARHGLYCFGCCVAFMGLMFVFGAMNLWWMAAIALYFLAEKIAPRAETWGRIAGAGLVVAGAAVVFASL